MIKYCALQYSPTVYHTRTAGAHTCSAPVSSGLHVIAFFISIIIISHGETPLALQVRLKPAQVTISSAGLGCNCI